MPESLPAWGDREIHRFTVRLALFKQLNWRREDEVQLLSVNANHPPLTLQVSEIASIQLVSGRVRRNALRRT